MKYIALIVAIGVVLAIALGVYVLITRRSRGAQGEDDWTRLWDARLKALEAALGPAEDVVLHSQVPFHLDGGADVLVFRRHANGVAYVTADLIGDDRAKPNGTGQYELMICPREDAEWAPSLISWLARYTIDGVLSPGDTMDMSRGFPQPTALAALLFVDHARINVNAKPAGVLLCVGITADELQYRAENGSDALISKC